MMFYSLFQSVYFSVRKESDYFNDEMVFKADMTHQIFGERYNNFAYHNMGKKLQCYKLA